MTEKPRVRIVDNKKMLLTNDEYSLYENICKGYDRPNFNGKDLFQDHFEVNNDGVIIFVKPPHKKYSSLEVYTFLVSIMVNQQLRISREQNNTFIKEATNLFKEKLQEIDNLKKDLEKIKKEAESKNKETK